MTQSDHNKDTDLSRLLPFRDFEAACDATLAFLQDRTGFRLWMVTRTEGEDWIVLAARDRLDHVKAGRVFRWQDSFCHHMVAGRGPRIVANVDTVELYRQTPIARQMRIGAYIGMPMMRADGSLFGTLCGVHPEPVAENLAALRPVLELLSRQLATLFEFEVRFEHEQRLRERAQAEAMVDELTGVFNRRGWQNLLEKEEQRCWRYGHPAGVLIVDLDELKEINDTQGHAAGDELLQNAAKVLRESSRGSDIIARLGGDEFGVLAIETSATQTEQLLERIHASLAVAGIRASIGWAVRHGEVDFNQAIAAADRMMYRRKRQRKATAGDKSN